MGPIRARSTAKSQMPPRVNKYEEKMEKQLAVCMPKIMGVSELGIDIRCMCLFSEGLIVLRHNWGAL